MDQYVFKKIGMKQNDLGSYFKKKVVVYEEEEKTNVYSEDDNKNVYSEGEKSDSGSESD
jgi:hypothetical protein